MASSSENALESELVVPADAEVPRVPPPIPGIEDESSQSSESSAADSAGAAGSPASDAAGIPAGRVAAGCATVVEAARLAIAKAKATVADARVLIAAARASAHDTADGATAVQTAKLVVAKANAIIADARVRNATAHAARQNDRSDAIDVAVGRLVAEATVGRAATSAAVGGTVTFSITVGRLDTVAAISGTQLLLTAEAPSFFLGGKRCVAFAEHAYCRGRVPANGRELVKSQYICYECGDPLGDPNPKDIVVFRLPAAVRGVWKWRVVAARDANVTDAYFRKVARAFRTCGFELSTANAPLVWPDVINEQRFIRDARFLRAAGDASLSLP